MERKLRSEQLVLQEQHHKWRRPKLSGATRHISKYTSVQQLLQMFSAISALVAAEVQTKGACASAHELDNIMNAGTESLAAIHSLELWVGDCSLPGHICWSLLVTLQPHNLLLIAFLGG